jgi:hypothetical protein
MTVDEYFEYNKKGAKVYRNPMKHALLEIPKIESRSEKGAVYDVLSVGQFWSPSIPIVTINEHGFPILYRLPDWYLKWAKTSQFLSSKGHNSFPSKVEFGYIIPDKQFYAEILDDQGKYLNEL